MEIAFAAKSKSFIFKIFKNLLQEKLVQELYKKW